jgi:hypothetical protein
LTEKDFDDAVKIKTDLAEKDKVQAEQLDKIKISTNSLFKKAF